jgi:hypothetical protein
MFRSANTETCNCQGVKFTADAVDICKRQRAMMGSISQEDENTFALGVDPATGSGESCMAKGFGGQTRSRG